MLSNAYFLAKFRFDTAENEPAKNLQKLLIFPILLSLTPSSKVPPETETVLAVVLPGAATAVA